YQLTQLYFLSLPFIALSAGTVYSQLRPSDRISRAINIALVFAVFSSLASSGSSLTNAFQLGLKVSTLNYQAAVLLCVVAVAAMLWTDDRSVRLLSLLGLLIALWTILVSRYLNPIVALLPALTILFWRRFVHRRIALMVGVLTAAGIVIEVLFTSIKLYDLDR